MPNKKGQALVEFALLVAVAAFLGFAVCDLSWMFFVNLTMQHAVRAGTRYAITGQTEPGMGRRESLIQRIREQSVGLYDRNLHVPKEPRISVVDPAQVNFANYTGTPTQNEPGERNQIIVVSLTYTCPLLTPVLKPLLTDGAYTFTVRSAMANENFPEKGGP